MRRSGDRAAGRPRRVLFSHASGAYGGMEIHVELVLRHLDRGRYEPLFVWPRDPVFPLPERLLERVRQLRVPVVRDSPSRLAALSPLLGKIRSFAALLASERVDLLHVHTFSAARPRVPFLGAAWARTPAVVRTEHLPPSPEAATASLRRSCRLFDRMADAVVTVSEHNRGAQLALLNRDPRKLRLLYNGIPIPPAVAAEERPRRKADLGFDPGVPLLAMVGRLHEQKGHALMLDALPRIIQEVGPVALALAGDGPLEAELRARVACAPVLSQAVRFLGHLDNAQELVAACDVGMMPSLYEGFSLTMLELMAAARPCVFSDHASFAEATDGGRYAVLCRTGDAGALAWAVAGLLRDGARARELGQSARRHVIERFSIDAHVRNLMTLYDELLA